MRTKKLSRGVASKAIRKYLKAHPWTSASVVVKDLAAEGIPVKENSVYSIRSFDKKKRKSKKNAGPVANIQPVNGTTSSITFVLAELVATKTFIKAVSGVGRARQLLDSIAVLYE